MIFLFGKLYNSSGPGLQAGCPKKRSSQLGAGSMKDVCRVAIVDPSDATREPLRNLLLGIESVWLEAECSRYEFFIDVAKQSTPDLAVIALDADQQKAVQMIAQMTVEFLGMPILAVSAGGDGQLILQALRSGAKEF